MQTKSFATRALAVAALTAAAFGVQAQTTQPTPGATDAKGTDALAAAFKRADANQDSKLTREEAARIPAVADKFDSYDKDKDGQLSMEELSSAMTPQK